MKLVTLLHEITQKRHELAFNSDFEGMVRITYIQESLPGRPRTVLNHEHVSSPDGSMEKLEEAVINSLSKFLKELK